MIKSIDQYISQYSKDIQALLRKMRLTIKNAAPSAVEMIKYGMPTFYQNGNLVHFAAFKNHIGFYPTPSAIIAFKKELAIYKSAKGSVQFPVSEPLPIALIAKMVRFRVKENSKK